MICEVERLDAVPSEGGLACHRPVKGYVASGGAL
jgi:hypothetical protein